MGVNTGKALAAENRRSQVLQMKMAGATEVAIAEQVGVSKTQVHNDIHRRLAEVRRDDKEAVQQLAGGLEWQRVGMTVNITG